MSLKCQSTPKMAHPRHLFRLFSSFQTNILNFRTGICEKCPRWDMNLQPSEHESPPITTRPAREPLSVFQLGTESLC